MSASLIDSGTFAFADGDLGHTCDLGSAPSVGQVDVLCVNSNTVVDTPSGFLVGVSAVGGQGAYIYRREAVGGEGQTVVVNTAGDHNTLVQWSRWGNVTDADQAGATQVNGVDGSSTPAHSTGTLAEADELVIAFGALHSLGVTPTSPVWSAGYTPLTAAGPQGSGGSGVVGYVAYRTDAGTAAEAPSVSWTGGAADRYMLTLTFTTAEGATAAGEARLLAGAYGVGAGIRRMASAAVALLGAYGYQRHLAPVVPAAVYRRPTALTYARPELLTYQRPDTLEYRRG